MLRRQATLLLLLACAAAFGALAAWALDPVQAASGSAVSIPLRWKSSVVGLSRRADPFAGDGKKRRKQEHCPRGVQVGPDVEGPPHKKGIHYEKYSLREYYGGESSFFFFFF